MSESPKKTMTHLQRFNNVMEYQTPDCVPNWEAGLWAQTRERWIEEGLDDSRFHWNWFAGEESLGMSPREFIPFHGDMLPGFPQKVLEEDEQTQTIQDSQGRIRKALKQGAIGNARASMDQFLRFPVQNMDDWKQVKKRFDPTHAKRYEPNWKTLRTQNWDNRNHPLIFGPNTTTMGFYWVARELMGTEGLSFAWYDTPYLMQDMMEFWSNFLIETIRPILEKTTIDYVCLSEDLAMKTGPLLSPDTYKTFIYPHLKKVIDFYKSHGVKYVCIDTDGNPEVLIPMMLDAGVDALWPLERAADQDPNRLRKTFGQSLRLWGAVDKREIAKNPATIDAHLNTLRPLIQEGGFIPTIDHTASPDISWPNFQYYMKAKAKLLAHG